MIAWLLLFAKFGGAAALVVVLYRLACDLGMHLYFRRIHNKEKQ